MECAILRNVVIWNSVGDREACDRLAVAGLDDNAQSPITAIPE
jgi:hypothetical protein